MRKLILFLSLTLCLWSSGVFAQKEDPALSLSLSEALKKAAVVNPQVVMASARVEQALGRLTQARSSLLPHIEGLAGENRQTRDMRASGIQFPGLSNELGPFNTFDARGRVTMSLFDPSALTRLKAAQKGHTLSKVESQKVRQDVMALVASLYLEANRKSQALELWRVSFEKDNLLDQLAQTQLSQGVGSSLEAMKAKASLSQARYMVQKAERDANEARMDLAAALQLPVEQKFIFTEEPSFKEKLDHYLEETKNPVNSDELVAQAQLEANKAQESSAKADFLPKISGLADYGRSGSSLNQASNTYTLGLQATIPIWEGGSQQGKLQEAKALVKESQEHLDDVSRQTQINIKSAQWMRAEAHQLLEAKSDQLAAAHQTLLNAQQRLTSGSGSAVEVSQAQALQALAQDEYNEAQAGYWLSIIKLAHVKGHVEDLIENKEVSK